MTHFKSVVISQSHLSMNLKFMAREQVQTEQETHVNSDNINGAVKVLTTKEQRNQVGMGFDCLIG